MTVKELNAAELARREATSKDPLRRAIIRLALHLEEQSPGKKHLAIHVDEEGTYFFAMSETILEFVIATREAIINEHPENLPQTAV